MSETYERKDEDTLIVTRNSNSTHIFEESRAEIQTQLDHLKLDKEKMEIDFQKKIDELENKIAVLDEV